MSQTTNSSGTIPTPTNGAVTANAVAAAVEGAGVSLAQYNPLREKIEKMKAANNALIFKYDDPKDATNARSHIFKLRKTRAEIEKIRVALKAESLAFGRKVDETAKSLNAEMEAMIDVHQKPLDDIENAILMAEEAKVKAEADAKAKAEQEERERQAAELAAAKAQAAKMEAELAEERRKIELERAQQIAAEKARSEAEEKARAEREAAAQRERIAAEAQRRAEREAEEARLSVERAKLAYEREAIEAEKRLAQEKKDAEIREAKLKEESDRRAKMQREDAERRAVEAAAAAQAEQEAAVKRAIEEKAAKDRADAEAAAKRAADKKVRAAIIKEVSKSMFEATTTFPEDTDPSKDLDAYLQALAGAMLDGRIPRVTVNTAKL